MPIDLHFVDELISVRVAQHGGGRGAPRLVGTHRIGTSINRSSIVMLSALLQSHVEEVFQAAVRRKFPPLIANQAAFESYWKQVKNWGNPSDTNIINLFLKLGVPNVFDGLSWQGTSQNAIKSKLDALNQIRNRISHGQRLNLNGSPYSLTLAKVVVFRNLAENFGNRFEPHVGTLVP